MPLNKASENIGELTRRKRLGNRRTAQGQRRPEIWEGRRMWQKQQRKKCLRRWEYILVFVCPIILVNESLHDRIHFSPPPFSNTRLYCDGTNSQSPTGPCKPGYFCIGAAKTAIQKMAKVGHYTRSGAFQPEPCPPGSFQPVSGINRSVLPYW